MVTGHQGQAEGAQDQVRIIDQNRSQELKQTRVRNQGGELVQEQDRAVGRGRDPGDLRPGDALLTSAGTRFLRPHVCSRPRRVRVFSKGGPSLLALSKPAPAPSTPRKEKMDGFCCFSPAPYTKKKGLSILLLAGPLRALFFFFKVFMYLGCTRS